MKDFCDDYYVALELGFIIWHDGKYYIRNGELKKEIKRCPFCGKKSCVA